MVESERVERRRRGTLVALCLTQAGWKRNPRGVNHDLAGLRAPDPRCRLTLSECPVDRHWAMSESVSTGSAWLPPSARVNRRACSVAGRACR